MLRAADKVVIGIIALMMCWTILELSLLDFIIFYAICYILSKMAIDLRNLLRKRQNTPDNPDEVKPLRTDKASNHVKPRRKKSVNCTTPKLEREPNRKSEKFFVIPPSTTSVPLEQKEHPQPVISPTRKHAALFPLESPLEERHSPSYESPPERFERKPPYLPARKRTSRPSLGRNVAALERREIKNEAFRETARQQSAERKQCSRSSQCVGDFEIERKVCRDYESSPGSREQQPDNLPLRGENFQNSAESSISPAKRREIMKDSRSIPRRKGETSPQMTVQQEPVDACVQKRMSRPSIDLSGLKRSSAEEYSALPQNTGLAIRKRAFRPTFDPNRRPREVRACSSCFPLESITRNDPIEPHPTLPPSSSSKKSNSGDIPPVKLNTKYRRRRSITSNCRNSDCFPVFRRRH